MKIKQYQEVYKLTKSDIPELEKAYHFYAIMKGKEYEDVEHLPINKVLKFYAKKLQKPSNNTVIPIYRIGLRFYRLNLNITHNTAQDNMAVISFCASEDSMVENLHNILATMTRRTKKQRKSAVHFERLANKIRNKVSWKVAYNLAGFFLTNYNETTILKRLTQMQKNTNTQLERLLQDTSN